MSSSGTHEGARKSEVKRKGKLANGKLVHDMFRNAINAKNMEQKPTGLVYDEKMLLHYCLWDENHPEKPERLTRIFDRCNEMGLVERCKKIPSRRATKDEVLLFHTNTHYEILSRTSLVDDTVEMESLCSKYNSIYIHPLTFELSLLAVGSAIDLIGNLVSGEIQNGMAIIRPPGHLAKSSGFEGHCFFNNVAIAAKYALDELMLNKIMIVDWDIHHAHDTQRFFYADSRVLLFSIHRFENGTFWPNLIESDFDAVGSSTGKGYNFNVPLNETGMGDGDYLAIFNQLLLPVAVEYQPELIIISAGYDAALCCPVGEMAITPAFYPHMLSSLMKLAQSRIAVILEGGYCLDSLAEGAALTLRCLLGDPCPMLVERLAPPSESVQHSILNCICTHRKYWRCLQIQAIYTKKEINDESQHSNFYALRRQFISPPPVPNAFPTRGTAPDRCPDLFLHNRYRLNFLKNETKLFTPKIRVCFAYDEMMLQHFKEGHPEKPERIKQIYEMLQEYGLTNRMSHLPIRAATLDEICLAHTIFNVNTMRTISQSDQLEDEGAKYNSVYFHEKTFDCASLAVGAVLQVVDKVLRDEARSGVCIVRPPGHHALPEKPHGFCIFNNIAIAALYAIRNYGLKRILIVDWDVHHGNGTQSIFESSRNVLYISLHRYENATFFPGSQEANFDFVGKGYGEGFNINIPWNKKGMGDFEYMLAFQQIIMPVAYEFGPELVLVSAGFDAAVGDPIGACKVSPEAYGLFTHWLSALANGRIILCLEGGYNIYSIAYAMTMCSKSLLGDTIPSIQIKKPKAHNAAYLSCKETIQNCLSVQQRYWKSLAFNKRLPNLFLENINDESSDSSTENMQPKPEKICKVDSCSDDIGASCSAKDNCTKPKQ